jgi:hypothetical protein
MLDHVSMLAIFATAIISVESEHTTESFETAGGLLDRKTP